MNWKHWLVISATSLFMACGQDHGNDAPKGTPLGTGGPAASGPSKNAPPGDDPHGGEAEKKAPPEVTVYLMGRFMAALSEKPSNAEPAPDWQVLLSDPANGVTCESCHPPAIVKSMLSKFDPNVRPAGIEEWEKDTAFMKTLMGKWVKRANEKDNPKHTANTKLKGDLKCTSCHAKTPT